MHTVKLFLRAPKGCATGVQCRSTGRCAVNCCCWMQLHGWMNNWKVANFVAHRLIHHHDRIRNDIHVLNYILGSVSPLPLLIKGCSNGKIVNFRLAKCSPNCCF